MFNIGDTVFYGTTGVCRIEELSVVSLGREKKQYYVLRPVAKSGSTVLVPYDNQLLLSKMRAVTEKSDLDKLVDMANADTSVWVDNPADRNRIFAETIKSGDCAETLAMLRLLVNHKNEVVQSGKKLHMADEKALHDALRLVTDEFSYALEVNQEQAEQYIMSKIKQ